ncbi:hypothetical protein [Sphingomonas sp. dw_22]|uniref:hypothetical protein n=1 Tax=Sphingomonas sp. dw_22 TaxID=2721175 RepID=UPI001BD6BA97|nr:hypothetical protein [Sphingomonas sp. dw_22]
MKVIFAAAIGLAALWPGRGSAGELNGPGRFCGYAPIIDLVAGERVVTLQGGIHGGTFRWEGAFGMLDVHGIGWASKPPGRIVARRAGKGPVRFGQRRVDGKYMVAIWNGRHGAAYFQSPRALTRAQLAAIDRVDLFEEGEEPQGCKLRTIFSWE